MAREGQPGERPRRSGGALRVLVLVLGFGLAAAATVALVTTEDPQLLRLAVVGALWAFVLGALAVPRRRSMPAEETGPEAGLDRRAEMELRRSYEVELEREVAARREYELQLEVYLRRELDQGLREHVDTLRQEVQQLRTELVERLDGELRMERIETTRLIGGSLRALQDQARRLGLAADGQAATGYDMAEPAYTVDESGYGHADPVSRPELPAGTGEVGVSGHPETAGFGSRRSAEPGAAAPGPDAYQDAFTGAGGHPQPGYPQPGYPQASQPQTGYPQAAYPQTGYPQTGYPHPESGGYPDATRYPQAPGYPDAGGYPEPTPSGAWASYPGGSRDDEPAGSATYDERYPAEPQRPRQAGEAQLGGDAQSRDHAQFGSAQVGDAQRGGDAQNGQDGASQYGETRQETSSNRPGQGPARAVPEPPKQDGWHYLDGPPAASDRGEPWPPRRTDPFAEPGPAISGLSINRDDELGRILNGAPQPPAPRQPQPGESTGERRRRRHYREDDEPDDVMSRLLRDQ
jgi:hypothetical protein